MSYCGGSGLMAVIPFILLFLALGFTRVKPAYVTGIVLVVTAFLAGIMWRTPMADIALSVAEGVLVALFPIIWVIAAAVFTYHISIQTGGIEILKNYLLDLTDDRNIQAVLIAFCFGGFLEAVAGFGTAVAIPVAILMAIGFPFVRAALICLVANSVPVAFGALGLPLIVLSNVSRLDVNLLTHYVALQLLPFSVIVPAALAMISAGKIKVGKKTIADSLIIGATFALAQTLMAFFVGPELVAVTGSLAALLVYVIIKRISGRLAQSGWRKLAATNVNYLILIVLVAVSRLPWVGFLKEICSVIKFGEHIVIIDWITTPGTLLFISAIAGARWCRLSWNKIVYSLMETASKIKWSVWTIINIVALAKLMGSSGITADIAKLLAAATGGMYPFFAPLTGMIGTFITGSDASSNILFGGLQKNTAISIGANPEWITAANTSGATAGKMISPQSIAVATATAGKTGEDNKILRAALPYCICYVVLLGLYVLVAGLFLK